MSNRRTSARRLLVVTYHFPPDGTIGGQRWAGLSKYLARAGWEVHVLTASPAGQYCPPAGVYRHSRPRRRTLNDLYRATVSRFRERSPDGPAGSASSNGPPTTGLVRTLGLIRRAVSASIGLPDHGRGWVIRAATAARMVLRNRHFDCVITSGPPHSAHFAGFLATWGRSTDFWIDMRDPWSMTHEMNTPLNGVIRAERHVLALLERLIFPRASRVLVNTREFGAALRISQPGLNVVHFPNGIDLEELPARDLDLVEYGSIAYVGTLYAGRNLSAVFAAMQSILHDQPMAAASLRLNIAGPLESPHREKMHADIDDAGLTSLVKVAGVLPRDAALELLSRSHLALVLAQDQPLCVPAKLYECVGLGIPTLVIAEADSAAAREARRIGAMTAEGHDFEAIKSVLTDMLAGRIPTKIAPTAAISYEDLALEMDRILSDRPATTRVRVEESSESLLRAV